MKCDVGTRYANVFLIFKKKYTAEHVDYRRNYAHNVGMTPQMTHYLNAI